MNRLFRSAALAAVLAVAPTGALAGSVYLNGVKIDGVTNQKFEKATVRIDEAGNIYIEAPGYAARVTTVTPAAPTPPVAPAPQTGAPTAAAPAVAPAAQYPGSVAPASGTAPAQYPVAATPASGTVPAQPPVAAAPATGAPAAPAAAPVAAAPTVPGRITQRYWLVTEQAVPGMTGYDIDVFINSQWLRKLRGNEDQVVADITRNLQPGANTVTLIARKAASGSRRSNSPAHTFRVIIGEGNEGGGNVMIDNPLIHFQKSAADTQDATQEFTLTTR
ncbi:hypothetical protein JY651_21250 [Pyxidicoccus parkwayensis]|uniref:PEGA domain-containing protein n=1 Tax=Pyxidicoccus parkwayensis TaxID=2813578 RepID=A0ABX7PA01_9BACT|nr:hypothetical protein [Pyxidicoccus parkwaysis]QSQ27284.1 hypothetical protein JY651_21250 [Pyxidicoccus parkwaysis]